MTLVPAAKIVPATGIAAVGAYILFYAIKDRKILGGTLPEDIPSLHPKWKELTELRYMNMEREGSPEKPVLLNPFRNNIPASIRNKDDFPELDG